MDETLDKLRREVFAYERRYQCGSREMLEALRDGKVKETRESTEWMNAFHNLVWLAERSGRTIVIPSLDEFVRIADQRVREAVPP